MHHKIQQQRQKRQTTARSDEWPADLVHSPAVRRPTDPNNKCTRRLSDFARVSFSPLCALQKPLRCDLAVRLLRINVPFRTNIFAVFVLLLSLFSYDMRSWSNSVRAAGTRSASDGRRKTNATRQDTLEIQ